VFVGIGVSVAVGLGVLVGRGVFVGGIGVSVSGAGVPVGGVVEMGVNVGVVVGVGRMGVGTEVSDATAVLVGVAPPEPNVLPSKRVSTRIAPKSPIAPNAANRAQGIWRRGDSAAPQ